MPKLVLLWPRDAEGHEIKYRGRRPIVPRRRRGQKVVVDPLDTVAGSGDMPAYFVGRSGRMREDDVMKVPGLYRRLALVKDDRAAVAFVDKFGLLRPGKQQPVAEVFATAEIVRELIDAHKKKDWDQIDGWLDRNGDAIQFAATRTTGESIDLFIKPRRLQDAIFAQMFEDFYGGAQLRLCKRPGCGEWFRYGPGTNPPRRNTAKFCSERCAQAVAAARRRGKEKRK